MRHAPGLFALIAAVAIGCGGKTSTSGGNTSSGDDNCTDCNLPVDSPFLRNGAGDAGPRGDAPPDAGFLHPTPNLNAIEYDCAPGQKLRMTYYITSAFAPDGGTTCTGTVQFYPDDTVNTSTMADPNDGSPIEFQYNGYTVCDADASVGSGQHCGDLSKGHSTVPEACDVYALCQNGRAHVTGYSR